MEQPRVGASTHSLPLIPVQAAYCAAFHTPRRRPHAGRAALGGAVQFGMDRGTGACSGNTSPVCIRLRYNHSDNSAVV